MKKTTPIALALLSLAACSSRPGTVELSKTYDLIDPPSGRLAGKVVLSPLGEGQLVDVNGAVVGRIVK